MDYIARKIAHMQRTGVPAQRSPNAGAAIAVDVLTAKRTEAKALFRSNPRMHPVTYRGIHPYLKQEG